MDEISIIIVMTIVTEAVPSKSVDTDPDIIVSCIWLGNWLGLHVSICEKVLVITLSTMIVTRDNAATAPGDLNSAL